MLLQEFIVTICHYRQVSFYTRVIFLKNIVQIECKILIWNTVFPEGKGIDTPILYSVW